MAQEFSENSPSLYSSDANNPHRTDRALNVDMGTMWEAAALKLPRIIDQIEEAWHSIGGTWDNLRLGWTGNSAADAQEFNHRLQSAQNRMFGHKGAAPDQDEPGILRLLRGGAVQASNNYSQAESTVAKMFNDFFDGLTGEGDGKPHAPTSDSNGPISVKYDNHNGVRYESSELVGQYMDIDGNVHELRSGDNMPVMKPVLMGKGLKYYAPALVVEKTWIDHDGHEHTDQTLVYSAVWKDDNGEIHRIDNPKNGPPEPLPLPDGVE